MTNRRWWMMGALATLALVACDRTKDAPAPAPAQAEAPAAVSPPASAPAAAAAAPAADDKKAAAAAPVAPAGAIPTPAPARPGPALQPAMGFEKQGGLGAGVSLIDEKAVGEPMAEAPPADKDPAEAAKRPEVCKKLLICTWGALKVAPEHVTGYETTRDVIDSLGADAAETCKDDLKVIRDNLTFRKIAVPEACR